MTPSTPAGAQARCPGSGCDVLPGLSYHFKSMLPRRQRFICGTCWKREWARIAGTRGQWAYVFEEHRGEGVTKQQWQAYRERTAQAAQIGAGRAIEA